MSTGTGPEDELIHPGDEGGRTRDGVPRVSMDEDRATRFTRGVVDGFTEASQAFSRELEGTNRFPELMGRSVAGVIRANARLLDEVATVVRQAADGWGERPRGHASDDFDYERLANLVAARLSATASTSGPEAAGTTQRRPRG